MSDGRDIPEEWLGRGEARKNNESGQVKERGRRTQPQSQTPESSSQYLQKQEDEHCA